MCAVWSHYIWVNLLLSNRKLTSVFVLEVECFYNKYLKVSERLWDLQMDGGLGIFEEHGRESLNHLEEGC